MTPRGAADLSDRALKDGNAVLWFAADGYVVKEDKINGRRVAGASFLQGFLDHAQVDSLIATALSQKQLNVFKELAEPYAGARKVETFLIDDLKRTAEVGCVYYPSPSLGGEAWRRFHAGQAAYSLCGITHTTATKAVMEQILQLRTAPVEPWDGLICTSRTVQAQILTQLEMVDAFLGRRFGPALPPRPQIPVIPLGIDTAAFAPDRALRSRFRKTKEIGEKDVVVMVLSRLSPHEKFDPLPFFTALEQAQAALEQEPGSPKLHLVLCGVFQDGFSEKLFKRGAPALMPNVAMHVLDGAKPQERATAFSCADIFAFPIDNIQETFGLAPIEGMAAGLPVLCSDWDGMRDTVTPDVGIRVPTRMAAPTRGRREAFRYATEMDTYPQYTSQVSGMTTIDVPATTQALITLARDPDLRARLGRAGKARARQLYDWAAVIPQMQDFWRELAAIRHHAGQDDHRRYHGLDLPHGPPPTRLFASYPSQEPLDPRHSRIHPKAREEAIDKVFTLRNYKALGRAPVSKPVLQRVLAALNKAQAPLTLAEIEEQAAISPGAAERAALWLIKYDLAATEQTWSTS